ncbi:mechanosensitive ion channel protein 6-like [Magnolia sinica]|uniref:mechanosensitive ion channel protein 6-like n=1 Tax=Magnolia sinica TaxID=86752 RepID=UPI002657B789|nr:mechanosensitive ion channel protein 6-like [Magnolia sinica]XP_058098401.1 mechanosensitive ion channel protein 6-like [Magnolia sinica]XP_058098402.1 mechanosensitive ion channel protein 6-like [Magnolia sinica]
MDSLRKSFKTHGAYKNMARVLGDGQEQLPILSNVDDMANLADHRDVVVKINYSIGNNRDLELGVDNKSQVWRGSNYEFWKEGKTDGSALQQQGNGDGGFEFQQRPPTEDPPSKLIGQFLQKQKVSGDMSLDMDLEMDELQQDQHLLPVNEDWIQQLSMSPKELKVSFQDPSKSTQRNQIAPEPVRQRHVSSLDGDDKRNEISLKSGEVLRCTSNSSFHRSSSLLQSKTKSRLMDLPMLGDEGKKSGMAPRQLRSAMMGKVDEDDDDPFLNEDLPDKFKQEKLDTVTVLQWLSLIIILAALICSFSVPFLIRQTVWDLHLWKWVVMVLTLICGRLVSGWVIRLIVFFIEKNFLLRKRVLYFVYGLQKGVQNCLWLGLVLITWHYIFDKKVEQETKNNVLPYVTKILVCLLVGTLIWLVKTLLLKVMASSFHVSTYFDRIQDSLFNQYVIETLSGPPLIENQRIIEEEQRLMAQVQKLQNAGARMPSDLKDAAMPSTSGRVIGSGRLQRSPRIGNIKVSRAISMPEDEGITIDHLHKLNRKNISAWNMKRLINIVRHRDLSTLDERILDSHSKQEGESTMQIRSEHEAKAAAKKIFTNIAMPGSKCICLDDLMRFMSEDEAQKTMGLFEGASESKSVSKTALRNWVVNAFRERRALSLTLNDTKTAVNKLHQMVNFVVGIIIVVIWLLILGIATTHLLVFISSQLLLVVFIFGNTCKMVFEAIIFLFAMHPFDVGDRCEVDGVQMVVEEMNILTTVFLRYDNQKISYPNSVLSTKPISNFYRSPDMGDAIEFSIHVSTPVEKLALMKERIKECIERNTEHWYPSPMIVVKDVEDMNKLKMAVWLQHRMNHQDMGERWIRRAQLVEEMIPIFRELDVEYRMVPQDVNIRNMPGLSSTRLPSTWATFT